MERLVEKEQNSVCDPVTLEIVIGALRAAQTEMEALLERTAMSPFVREKKDYWAAMYDSDARMVAGTVLPLFGKVVEPILEIYPKETMRAGDVYWYNDCYASQGAVSHSPDQVLVAPVFVDDEFCGYVQSWAHLSDIGGMYPGSLSPHATSIFQEGLMIPPLRLHREGVPNEEALRIFERNSRFPTMLRGDMRALVAALHLGERRFIEIIKRFGRGITHNAFKQLQDRTETRVRRLFRETFPNGTYHFDDLVDGDGHGNGPFAVRLELKVSDESAVLDTTKTDDQAVGPINYLMHPVVPSLVLGIYLTARDQHELLNDGIMRIVDEVLLRQGSLLQPDFPAPLGQRSLTWIRLQTAFMGLINTANGGKGVASSPAYSIYYMRGKDPQTGEPFLLQDGVAVGFGARSFSDGLDAVYYVAQENYPAEFLNTSYPVRLHRYCVNRDSGGPGRWRGGCGVIREVEVLADEVMMSVRLDSTVKTPWGVSGGMSGRPGRVVVNPGRPTERVLPALTDGVILKKGDLLRMETGGGGGSGHPYDRPAEMVRLDVLRGFISGESAARDYGVVLVEEAGDFRILEDETESIRSNRPATKMFHRQKYLDQV